MLSGRRLDLLDPSPADIEVSDIAHGLARLARWNGQTLGDHAFSVAQHALVVEEITAALEPDWGDNWRLAALLHDAPEYVIGDLISPFKAAAASIGVEAIIASIHDIAELESAIAAQAREPNSGLIVMPDSFMTLHRVEIASLAAQHSLPSIYYLRLFAESGGLLSYGNDLVDNFRRAAVYADRILKGTKPSDLPVQAPVKFELVINASTAKALGLTVPLTLRALADEVIE